MAGISFNEAQDASSSTSPPEADRDPAQRVVEDSTLRESSAGLLTVSQVARLLGIHGNTVRLWSNRGLLPCYRIGPRGDRRFSREGVRRFLASQPGQDKTPRDEAGERLFPEASRRLDSASGFS